MKRMVQYLREIFSPKDLHNLDVQDILSAMSDPVVRKIWLVGIFDEFQHMNLEVDKRLLNGRIFPLTDLAVRRKAYQDVLEAMLSARRRVRNPNPKSGSFDLDSVTVQSV